MEVIMDSRIKAVGQKVAQLRKSLGMTQDELAQKSGLSRVFIGQFERGEVNPSLENIFKIIDATGWALDIRFVKP